MVYQKTSLRNSADKFAIAGCVLLSLLIIPMCWIIPMTLSIRKHIRNNEQVTLGLSICYMIFGGIFCLVAGILLIVDESKQNKGGK